MTDADWAARSAPELPADDWSWQRAVTELTRRDAPATGVRAQLDARLAALAVPPGSLGRLADVLAAGVAATGTMAGPPDRPTLVVAAGDHGLHARGVSPWPQTISTAVAGAIARGDAAAGVLARDVGVRVVVLDVGLATAAEAHPRLLARPVRRGTRDALGPSGALTATETAGALATGAALAHTLIDEGTDLLLLGDVGITNTTASAALIATLLAVEPAAVTGRGSGIDDATLARKREVVATLVARAAGRDPVEVLAGIGGAEHAATVGVLLAAAERRVPVLLDGLISAACGVVATALTSAVGPTMIAGHRPPEPAAAIALESLGLRPLLDLELRVGEGTGALLALPLLRAAWTLLEQTVTLEDLAAHGSG